MPPITDNALKAIVKVLEDQNRELKKIHTALTALNNNLVEAVAALRPKED